MSKKKQKEPKRTIEIEGIDKKLELSKYTQVNMGGKNFGTNFIHFDELEDGTWRLVHTKDVIPDMKEVKGFKIIREDL